MTLIIPFLDINLATKQLKCEQKTARDGKVNTRDKKILSIDFKTQI